MAESGDNNIKKPVALVILDGWGIGPPGPGNAITQAETPNIDSLIKRYFTTTLHAAGEAVGLKWGEMGNSEVGHLTIGAGRTVFQNQPRIDRSIIDGSFFENPALLEAMANAQTAGTSLHLVGLLSDTGVHATIEHLYGLLELAQQQKLSHVYIHAILDGRDAPHNSGKRYLEQLQAKLDDLGLGQVASLSGRFYAMDRDNNWERTSRAYDAMTAPGVADKKLTDALEAIKQSYAKNVFDEQFEPVSLVNEQGEIVGPIKKGDSVVFFNFRPDRARQLTRALVSADFAGFERPYLPDIFMVTMVQYDGKLKVRVAFPPDPIQEALPDVLEKTGYSQLHVAETEKYAHVTYFMAGGREKPFAHENRVLVPSLGVASYETKPQMSAPEIRHLVLSDLQEGAHDFYIVNFANADMVGHTGNLKAAIQGVQTIDDSLGAIAKVILEQEGLLVITADHGNAEVMLKPSSGEINKEHSANPVPFILAGPGFEREKELEAVPDLSGMTPGGFLSDIAPTILMALGLKQPAAMNGRSLI